MSKETLKFHREDPISKDQSDQSFSFLNSKSFNYPATGKSIEEGVNSIDKLLKNRRPTKVIEIFPGKPQQKLF